MTFDTCFLIDFQREQHRSREGAAHEFMRRMSDRSIALSAAAFGEFARGFSDPDDPTIRHIASLFHFLPADRLVALRYSRLVRLLRQSGAPIGANDLWIAATALANGLPLVTRNVSHFQRIPDLELIGY